MAIRFAFELNRLIEYDRLLVALGRRPAGDDIALDVGGVEFDERGFVQVGARLRTTGDHIWADRDAVDRVCFTHESGHQGPTATANAPSAPAAPSTTRRYRE